jgi:hypothetical protein
MLIHFQFHCLNFQKINFQIPSILQLQYWNHYHLSYELLVFHLKSVLIIITERKRQ